MEKKNEEITLSRKLLIALVAMAAVARIAETIESILTRAKELPQNLIKKNGKRKNRK